MGNVSGWREDKRMSECGASVQRQGFVNDVELIRGCFVAARARKDRARGPSADGERISGWLERGCGLQ